METVLLFMKKLKDKIKMLKNKILEKKEVFVIMLVALISLFPLYYPGFIYTHDGIIHLFRTQGVYENIVNFDAFNRIYYNMANGIGWDILSTTICYYSCFVYVLWIFIIYSRKAFYNCF